MEWNLSIRTPENEASPDKQVRIDEATDALMDWWSYRTLVSMLNASQSAVTKECDTSSRPPRRIARRAHSRKMKRGRV